MCVSTGTSSADQPGTSARVCLRAGLPVALPARRCHQPVIDSSDKRRGSLQILPAHVTLSACLCVRGSQRTLPMHVTLTLSASYHRGGGKDAVSEMKDRLKYKMDLERGGWVGGGDGADFQVEAERKGDGDGGKVDCGQVDGLKWRR